MHKELGPGLLESVYEDCLCYELAARRLSFDRQKEIPVVYKGNVLDASYRFDIFIEDSLVLELKAVDHVLKVHKAQILSYMKLLNVKVGLLVNFKVPVLKDGVNRFVL